MKKTTKNLKFSLSVTLKTDTISKPNNWLFHNQEEKEAEAASQKSQDKPDESVSYSYRAPHNPRRQAFELSGFSITFFLMSSLVKRIYV